MSIVLLKLPLRELIEVDEMGLLLTVKLCGMATIGSLLTLKLCGVVGMNWPLIQTLRGVSTG